MKEIAIKRIGIITGQIIDTPQGLERMNLWVSMADAMDALLQVADYDEYDAVMDLVEAELALQA